MFMELARPLHPVADGLDQGGREEGDAVLGPFAVVDDERPLGRGVTRGAMVTASRAVHPVQVQRGALNKRLHPWERLAGRRAGG
jgi:hypothetical protein